MGSPAPNKSTTLSQGLKIAGTGGITKSELSTIADTTGKSTGDIIKRLDKINQNLKGKDQTGINLNAGAANMLIKEAQKSTPSIFGAQPSFGTGRIGQTLTSRLGSPGFGGITRQGQTYGQREAVAPSFMLGGTAIRPGGRETVRGFGKQYEVPSRLMQPSVAATTEGPAAGSASATGGTTVPTTTEETVPAAVEPTAIAAATTPMNPYATALANWAQGFRRKQSSRKMAGRKSQGYGSMAVNAPKTNTLAV
jgi:hypothetical protein